MAGTRQAALERRCGAASLCTALAPLCCAHSQFQIPLPFAYWPSNNSLTLAISPQLLTQQDPQTSSSPAPAAPGTQPWYDPRAVRAAPASPRAPAAYDNHFASDVPVGGVQPNSPAAVLRNGLQLPAAVQATAHEDGAVKGGLYSRGTGGRQSVLSGYSRRTGCCVPWLLPSEKMMARFEFIFEDVLGVSRNGRALLFPTAVLTPFVVRQSSYILALAMGPVRCVARLGVVALWHALPRPRKR